VLVWDHLNELKWAKTVEEELRLWLAEQLKRDPERDPVFDKLWRMLKSEGHVSAAEQMCVTGDTEEEELARSNLLRVARVLRPYAEYEAGPIKPTRPDKKKELENHLRLDDICGKERVEVLGEYLALRGSLHPLVRRFRKEVLGGKTLTPKQAYALVDSAAVNRFPASRFEREGIPVVEHSAGFIEHGVVFRRPRTNRFIEFEYIFVDPPGGFFRTHLPVSVAYDDLEYFWFPRGNPRAATNDGYRSVEWDSEYFPTPVYPGSILDDLRQLSLKLADEYGRCWDQGEAAWFVLTDEPLAPRVITATYQDHYSEHLTHGTITLAVEPWVPAKTVSQFYQYVQKDMLGRKSRAPERRNLAVFHFVVRQSREAVLDEENQGETSSPLSWEELMKRWNRKNPHQKYAKESRFRRDVNRGGRAVLSPYDRSEVLKPFRLTVP
jgi:hypothetical protein